MYHAACKVEFQGPNTRNSPDRISIFVCRIEFYLHLIGQKMNHQEGIIRISTKNRIQQRSKKILCRSNLVENRSSTRGVCPPRHGMFYVTEAGHANWCHVVHRLRGEKPPLRKVRPPEQPQRGLRRSLGQRRPPATLRKRSRPPQTQFFRRPAPRKLHDQLPHDDFAQKFDRYIPVAAARVGRPGGASPSKRHLEP